MFFCIEQAKVTENMDRTQNSEPISPAKHFTQDKLNKTAKLIAVNLILYAILITTGFNHNWLQLNNHIFCKL